MKSWTCIIITVLLAGIIVIPGANAENQTRDTIYLLTHGETLAGQKDMSKYSNIPKPEPVRTMNATAVRIFPNMTACGNNGCIANRPCPFPFTWCKSPLTLMVMYNVNATRPGLPGEVIGYSLTGWPLEHPVTLTGPGKPDLFWPYGDIAGRFA